MRQGIVTNATAAVSPGPRRYRRNLRRLLALIIAAFLCAVPVDLLADGPRERADKAFRDGYTLYSMKDYEGALSMFLRARALFPSYKIDLNIGYTLDAMGRKAEAARYFELFLARADSSAGEGIEGKVRQRLRELAKELSRVTLDCPVSGAVFSVDGKEVARTPVTHTFYVSPGRHGFRVAKGAKVLFERKVVMVRGGHSFITIPRPAAARPPVPAPALTPTEPASPRKRFYKKWWFWTTVGAVVVGAVVVSVVATQTGGSDWLPAGDSGSIRLH